MRTWHSPINPIFNRAAPRICMAGGSRCKKAIKAHGISERRVLRKIAENGLVVTTIPADTIEGITKFGPRGIGQVSTFTGLCSKHDSELFRSIDQLDYSFGNKEQEFFFAYRTLAQSLWFSLAGAYMQEAISKTFDNVTPVSDDVLPQVKRLRDKTRNRMVERADDARCWLDIKDAQNLNASYKNYTAMDSIALLFPDPYPIAYNGVILLRHGRTDEETRSQPHVVTVNTFPQNQEYYAVLTCVNAEHKPYLEALLDSFRILDVTDNRVILSHLMCGFSESIAIRPSYWERLSEKTRLAFTEHWRRAAEEGNYEVNPEMNIFNPQLLV